MNDKQVKSERILTAEQFFARKNGGKTPDEMEGDEQWINANWCRMMMEQYGKYLQEANALTEDGARPVRVNALVSLLEERKAYYREKAQELLLQEDYDQDEFNNAQFMYGRYIDVCADIYSHLKEKAG